MVKIYKDIINQNANNVPSQSMTPRYITVHNTANNSKGADAKMHARYQKNGSGGRQASWHYTCDDKEIYQTLEDNQQGWHAGDNKGSGNTQSIGIEICENSDGDFEKAVKNAQWLINKLMSDHNIPLKNVVTHKHWSGKNCPHLLLNRWTSFKSGIGSTQSSTKTYTQDAKYPKLENYGANVGKWQRKLKESGYYNGKIDNSFGPATDKATRSFQSDNNLAVDGQAGPASNSKADKIIKDKNNGFEWVGTKSKGRRIQSIHRGKLNYYDGPRWDNPTGTFNYGEGWKVDNLYSVKGSLMYRVQNSKGDLYWITASSKYVKVV